MNKEMQNKAKNLNEPDDIMLMDEEDFLKSYDIDLDLESDKILSLENEINDLAFSKEELSEDIENMTYIINNENLDYIRANELFDEIKYNQIEILKIEDKLSKLRKKYNTLLNKKDENYFR